MGRLLKLLREKAASFNEEKSPMSGGYFDPQNKKTAAVDALLSWWIKGA